MINISIAMALVIINKGCKLELKKEDIISLLPVSFVIGLFDFILFLAILATIN